MLSLDLSLLEPRLPRAEMEAGASAAAMALRSLAGRTCPGAGMLGWLDLPDAPADEIRRIADWGKRVQDDSECLVVIGIGGSYLGARAAIEALPGEAAFPVYFAGTDLCPERHELLLRAVGGRRFSICVISKSGTTIEPAIALRLWRRALVERHGAAAAAKLVTAVTDRSSGVLRRLAVREGWRAFDVPPDVGGRFSVLSPVGLLPCAAAGIPIGEMLEGARSGRGRWLRPDSENEATRYALARHLLHRKGCAIEVLSTFHPSLASLAEWWKQLAGESEGKAGGGLFPASAIMTTDLHSLGQYLQEGSRSLLETFLSAPPRCPAVAIAAEPEDADGLNYLAGMCLDEVNRRALEGTREAHAAGGIPVITIETAETAPGTLGTLFFFFEVAIAVSALLRGLDPFNQPGVEEYKKRMLRLLGAPEAKT